MTNEDGECRAPDLSVEHHGRCSGASTRCGCWTCAAAPRGDEWGEWSLVGQTPPKQVSAHILGELTLCDCDGWLGENGCYPRYPRMGSIYDGHYRPQRSPSCNRIAVTLNEQSIPGQWTTLIAARQSQQRTLFIDCLCVCFACLSRAIFICQLPGDFPVVSRAYICCTLCTDLYALWLWTSRDQCTVWMCGLNIW